MGIYLGNQIEGDQEEWLKKHATEVTGEEWTWEKRQPGQMPLCMITDYHYKPVLICWYRMEMERALPSMRDQRGRRYFFAPVSDVVDMPSMRSMKEAMLEDVIDGLVQEPVEIEGEAPDDEGQ